MLIFQLIKQWKDTQSWTPISAKWNVEKPNFQFSGVVASATLSALQAVTEWMLQMGGVLQRWFYDDYPY